jgi:hypothetical protein
MLGTDELWLKECVENCPFFSDLGGIDHEVFLRWIRAMRSGT